MPLRMMATSPSVRTVELARLLAFGKQLASGLECDLWIARAGLAKIAHREWPHVPRLKA